MENVERTKAPDIFTGKDLDYLKDMFGWNHTAFKMMNDSLKYVEDRKVEKVISDCSKLFLDNMEMILNIIKDGMKNE